MSSIVLRFDAEAVAKLEADIRLRMFRHLAYRRFERVERQRRASLCEFGTCDAKLECGGSCCLEPGHARPCECIGDEPWRPGSCPA